MKKLIIHIGYMKTATTSLQLNLFAQLKDEGKIEYLNHLNRKDKNLGDFYCKNILAYIMGVGDLTKCQSELKELTSITNEISLISNENISLYGRDFTWAEINSNARLNAKRINDIFSQIFDEIEIIITVRAQRSLIPSFYAQVYKYVKSVNKTSTLSSWIKNQFSCEMPSDDELIFNFDQMYTAYSKVFGSENVNVLIYEDLKYEKAQFYKQLAEILNITPSKLGSLLESNVQNKTIKSESNSLVAEAATFSDVFLSFIRRPFKKLLPKQLFKPLRSAYHVSIGRILSLVKMKKQVCIDNITEDEKAFIQQRFNASNLRLAKKLNLGISKLKKYGYLAE